MKKDNPSEKAPSQPGPTLRDIAAATGVSLSTVSCALNSKPGKVGAETRKRIQQKAAEMGYTPNPLVKALMKQVQHGKIPNYKETIAFLTGYPEKEGWKKQLFIVEQFEQMKQTAKKQGYEVEPFWLLNPNMNPARLAQVLLSRGIHAVVASPLVDAMEINNFPWKDFHSIAIGYSLIHPAINRGTADLIQVIRLALQKAFDAGFRSPVLIIPAALDNKTRHQVSISWQYYIKEIFRLRDCRIQPVLEYTRQFKPNILKTIDRKKADVIIGCGASSFLKRIGVNIPEDISYVSINRISEQTAGVSQQWNHIASEAVQFLISKIESNAPVGLPEVPVMISVPPVWQDGPTLRSIH